MRALTGAIAVVCAALLFGICTPAAHADDWNRKTIVKLYTPIEIPGRVLGPGTYVFTLANSQNDRHIVRIWTNHQRRLVDTILAIPVSRDEPASHTILRFDERPIGSPEALAEWFYPGDDYGQGFVYHFEWPVHTHMQASNAAYGAVSRGQ